VPPTKALEATDERALKYVTINNLIFNAEKINV